MPRRRGLHFKGGGLSDPMGKRRALCRGSVSLRAQAPILLDQSWEASVSAGRGMPRNLPTGVRCSAGDVNTLVRGVGYAKGPLSMPHPPLSYTQSGVCTT
mmetsp:Transcript_138758/g.241282  ORF Transcript_138758/g.241282 Transcript_138758/m.241282 type:complete len:100 (+) Transcript_138758:710-1009(+)